MKLAMLASERATCPRMHCGCVIVKNKYVLSTGYNGSLPGAPHCYDVGCIVINNHCIRTNHAEINALAQAARHGVSLDDSTAYITNMPCTTCAKALIAAGIRRVVVFSDYHDTRAEEFFAESGVAIDRIPMPDTEINYDIESWSSARPFER